VHTCPLRLNCALPESACSLSTTFFLFPDTATPEIYTLSLHDALPIYALVPTKQTPNFSALNEKEKNIYQEVVATTLAMFAPDYEYRSEEHTSELQSRFDLVCRLLLEKKKQINK